MYKIAALYKFSMISNPSEIHNKIRQNLKKFLIKGTILVSHEGINGTISSSKKDNLYKGIQYLMSIDGLDDLDIKYSESYKKPFVRLKVKLKEEIVTIGDTSIDPTESVGKYVDPKDWDKLLENENTILIDTRNNYEYSIGTFENSINPKTDKFREFPKWVKKQKFSKKDKETKNIVMFCTGGIRCEKASSFMINEGFKNVYHLKGGILKYFESFSRQQSKWKGECFVFDERVSLKKDLTEGTYDMCHGCRMPITESDKMSKKFIKGVSCSNCFDKKTKIQKLRYMSRQKQINLAKEKNKNHIGPREETLN
jgi:UPF0176 protein|tara:strand:- start:18617 stop:19549 length:933 start_codon:yes stop_codon:yes gene_type:complete